MGDRAGDLTAAKLAEMTESPREPERLLEGLNGAQREAVIHTRGPLAIVAGAGSGKTRVISHRAAYAIETGAAAEDRILLVTFTDKAAGEMVERMRSLGHAGVLARTFHAAALAQLRHFWPSRHDGAPLPNVIDSKARILVPLASRLPGHYRFTPVKDLAEAIEWAKVRRIRPNRWPDDGAERAPIPPDLFGRLFADYERAKTRAEVIDFEDMLVETVELLEHDDEAAAIVRARKTWFSVDEYQDTNPLAERLLELWLGDSRDLAVVGDPDQTIYSFTGASPEFLLGFERRHPGARTVALVENYRSTPQILGLANRLVGPGIRGALRATRAPGPEPTIRRFADDAAERVGLVAAISGAIAAGTDPGEIAVLVRINAQLPEIEDALTRAGIPFRVRGQRFFERREVRDARQLLRRARLSALGPALGGQIRELFEQRLGLGDDSESAVGDEGRERAGSLELIVEIVEELASKNPELSLATVLAELDRRDSEEAAGSTNGVNLLTYHRAKGLEWDVVLLPALEEGLLPIRQAKEDDAVDEERRLLYVGITRARRTLWLSWAQRRIGPGGKETGRSLSRFLALLEPPARTARARRPYPSGSSGTRGDGIVADDRPSVDRADAALLDRLHQWRRQRAQADAVPAYVVAHDAMLRAIAEARPRSETALLRIGGMGPVKLERYGADILAIVAAHAE